MRGKGTQHREQLSRREEEGLQGQEQQRSKDTNREKSE